ncbi:MAG TPA: sialidase family protein [Actinomycetota bacterium]|nr:sialidase family protein [Actinomycetota bacterium]
MTEVRPRPSRAVFVWSLALAASLVITVAVQASAGPSSAYGKFGFIGKNLGKTPAYGEPTLAIAPDGKHVVASTPGSNSKGQGTVQIWYSKDDGKSWHSTYYTSPSGGGDSEIDFLPNGTLLSADLELTDSYIQMSKDYGKTWKPIGEAGMEQDRQWLAHSPDGKTAYLVYHDFVLEAEWIAVSNDGGNTWSTSPLDQIPVTSVDQVAPPALVGNGGHASIIDQGVNTFSGPLLVNKNGRDLYVVYSISDVQSNVNPLIAVPPFGPVRQLVLSHSGDGGQSWESHVAVQADQSPNGADEDEVGTLFPWGFIDQGGTVYMVYNSTQGAPEGHFHQYYVYTKDHGATWSRPVKLDGLPMDQGAAVYATGDAVRAGVIDVAWYESTDGVPSDDSAHWKPVMAQVTGANTPHPKVTRSAVTSTYNHHGGICLQGILCGIAPGSSDRSLLDFFQLVVNPKTHMAEIAFADNYRLADNHDFGTVVVAKQTKTPGSSTKSSLPGLVAVLPMAIAAGWQGRRRRKR